jgi:hypothetical protein
MTASEFLADLAQSLEDGPLPECDRLSTALLCRDYATIAIDGPEQPEKPAKVLYRWYGSRPHRERVKPPKAC